jgi:hypothetical protein
MGIPKAKLRIAQAVATAALFCVLLMGQTAMAGNPANPSLTPTTTQNPSSQTYGDLEQQRDDNFGAQAPTPPLGINPVPGQQTFAWQDTTKYEECDQTCLYRRANENLSLQALTILTRSSRMQDVVNGDPTNQEVHDELANEHYCESGDNTKLCLSKYLAIQIPVLQAIRGSILNNEDVQSRLRAPGKVLVGAMQAANAPKKLPQLPFAPTTTDLRATRAEDAKNLDYLGTDDYQHWFEKMKAYKPTCDDFPLTKVVKADPSDPNGKDFIQVVRDANGKVKCDQSQLKTAQKEYSDHIAYLDQDLKNNLKNEPAIDKQNAMRAQNSFSLRSPASAAPANWADKHEIDDYKEARFQVQYQTDSILNPNGKLTSKNTLSFSGSKTAPAGQNSGPSMGDTLNARTQKERITTPADIARATGKVPDDFSVSYSPKALANEICALQVNYNSDRGGNLTHYNSSCPH